MKLTAKLALSQLKVNRRRTSWTFLGITLSAAMLTTIYGLGFGTGMDWIDRITMHSDLRQNYYAFITGLAVIMSIFVLAISVIVISNAFRVSASERMSQFGVLKSVGATKSQIMQTVIYEGLYLTIIGIPVGILIGLSVQFISIGLINDVIEPLLSYDDLASGNYMMYFIWSWFALFSAVGVSLLTVFLSAWLPARKASLVSAINAIRGIGEVRIKNKKVRGGVVVRKVFGIEGMLARIFLKRSKRNFRATVIAMSFSVAIFIVAGGFFDQMSRFAEIQWGSVDANVALEVSIEAGREVDCDGDEWDEEGGGWTHGVIGEDNEWVTQYCFVPIDTSEVARTIDEFNELHGALARSLHEGDRLIGIASEGMRHSVVFSSNEMSDEFVRIREDSWGERDDHELSVEFIVVDDAFASELAEIAGVEVGSNILLNHGRYWLEDGRVLDFELLNFNYQTLNVLLWDDELERMVEDSEMAIELHGQITPETRPSQLDSLGMWGIRVIVPESNLEIMEMMWFVQTEDSAGITEAGETLLFEYFDESGVPVSLRALDLDAEERVTRNTIGLVMFFIFGFVGTLILIGLTNVISTISENVKTRAGEFAVLQSVGMTSGGIKQMLNLESAFSSLRSLIIGVPLGILGSYGIYISMRNMGIFNFSIPWLWVVSSVLAIFLVTWLTMRYAANKLKDRNIIDTIRSGSGM